MVTLVYGYSMPGMRETVGGCQGLVGRQLATEVQELFSLPIGVRHDLWMTLCTVLTCPHLAAAARNASLPRAPSLAVWSAWSTCSPQRNSEDLQVTGHAKSKWASGAGEINCAYAVWCICISCDQICTLCLLACRPAYLYNLGIFCMPKFSSYGNMRRKREKNWS